MKSKLLCLSDIQNISSTRAGIIDSINIPSQGSLQLGYKILDEISPTIGSLEAKYCYSVWKQYYVKKTFWLKVMITIWNKPDATLTIKVTMPRNLLQSRYLTKKSVDSVFYLKGEW